MKPDGDNSNSKSVKWKRGD